MSVKAHFKVFGRFNGKNQATVTIDRDIGLITVRPHHFKKTYEMRLTDVAESIMWKVIAAELREKKAAKKAKKKLGY